MKNFKSLFLILFLLFLFNGCQNGIINDGQEVGKNNEPVSGKISKGSVFNIKSNATDIILGNPVDGWIVLYSTGNAISDTPFHASLVSQFKGKKIIPAGYMNRDKSNDVIVGNTTDGWFVQYSGIDPFFQGPWFGSTESYWKGCEVKPTGDMNGDGLSDVLIGNPSIGWCVRYSTGNDKTNYPWMGNMGWFWQGYNAIPAGDLNGDGLSDILLGNPSSGWCVRYSTGSTNSNYPWTGNMGWFWQGYEVKPTGNMNGDNMSDILIGNSTAGWCVRYSTGNINSNYPWIGNMGWFWQGLNAIPTGDMNNDGMSDILIGNLAAGWCARYSTNNIGSYYPFYGNMGWFWQGCEVKPTGDMNEDGMSDILLINSDNRWFVRYSVGDPGSYYPWTGSMSPNSLWDFNSVDEAIPAGNIDGNSYEY